MDELIGEVDPERERWLRLTDKQRACLDLLLEYQTSKQIARRLQISKPTVDLRLTVARDILGAADRSETAAIYARLKQSYDQITCDPVQLPPRPKMMRSHFADGSPPNLMDLRDSAMTRDRLASESSPSGGLWRPDHSSLHRVMIMAAMLVVAVIAIMGGLSIGHVLTELLAG